MRALLTRAPANRAWRRRCWLDIWFALAPLADGVPIQVMLSPQKQREKKTIQVPRTEIAEGRESRARTNDQLWDQPGGWRWGLERRGGGAGGTGAGGRVSHVCGVPVTRCKPRKVLRAPVGWWRNFSGACQHPSIIVCQPYSRDISINSPYHNRLDWDVSQVNAWKRVF